MVRCYSASFCRRSAPILLVVVVGALYLGSPLLRKPQRWNVYQLPMEREVFRNTSAHFLNIDDRGKWQQQQVDAFCKKHGMADMTFSHFPEETLLKRNLFRHLIFDDKRRYLFCFIPKVGCTTMRRFLFTIQGLIPRETVHWDIVDEDEYLAPAIQIASFRNSSLTDEQRMKRVRDYYRFVIVRHPLERLVSAFRDKLEGDLVWNITTSKIAWNQRMKIRLLSIYKERELNVWQSTKGIGLDLRVEFSDYITWIVDSEDKKLNEHFATFIAGAQPCLMRYHFYADFDQYSSDIQQVAHELGLDFDNYFKRDMVTEHSMPLEKSSLLNSYYSTLSDTLKKALVIRMQQDLDFYYHIFPDRKNGHVSLLGNDVKLQ